MTNIPAIQVGKRFNEYVIEVLLTYPADGTYTYSWTSEENYVGITKDLFYLGDQFVIGDPERRSYCSGITFEVFFQAYQQYLADRGLKQVGHLKNAAEMEEFRLKWYGVGGDRRTIKHALEWSGLGYQLTDLGEVEKGDFVQIWRHNGSGHTVIFIGWVYDAAAQIIGFNYWSSNKDKGPSYQTEYFGPFERNIIPEETFFMKVIEPTQR